MERRIAYVIALTLAAFAGGYFAGNRAASEAAADARLDRLSARIEELSHAYERRLEQPLRCAAVVDTRAVVNEILPALGGVAGPAAQAGDGAAQLDELAEAEPPASEMIAAVDQARRLIDGARANGRWGDSQATEMRNLLAQLDQPTSLELMNDVASAINSGALKTEMSGAPF
jgi:hypothetical protein